MNLKDQNGESIFYVTIKRIRGGYLVDWNLGADEAVCVTLPEVHAIIDELYAPKEEDAGQGEARQ